MTKLRDDLEAAMGQSGSDSPMFGCDYDGNDFIRDHAAEILAMVEDAEREIIPMAYVRVNDLGQYKVVSAEMTAYGMIECQAGQQLYAIDLARKGAQ